MKCYFAKHKLVWEVLDGGLKSKIEIQWSDICALKVVCPETEPGTLEIAVSTCRYIGSAMKMTAKLIISYGSHHHILIGGLMIYETSVIFLSIFTFLGPLLHILSVANFAFLVC